MAAEQSEMKANTEARIKAKKDLAEKETERKEQQTEVDKLDKEVKELEDATALHRRTLQRAAKKLRVKRTRDGERGLWVWELPRA